MGNELPSPKKARVVNDYKNDGDVESEQLGQCEADFPEVDTSQHGPPITSDTDTYQGIDAVVVDDDCDTETTCDSATECSGVPSVEDRDPKSSRNVRDICPERDVPPVPELEDIPPNDESMSSSTVSVPVQESVLTLDTDPKNACNTISVFRVDKLTKKEIARGYLKNYNLPEIIDEYVKKNVWKWSIFRPNEKNVHVVELVSYVDGTEHLEWELNYEGSNKINWPATKKGFARLGTMLRSQKMRKKKRGDKPLKKRSFSYTLRGLVRVENKKWKCMADGGACRKTPFDTKSLWIDHFQLDHSEEYKNIQ